MSSVFENKEFTVLIPARRDSTRLPNKPLADIAGIPMVVRVARQALRSQASRVVVATDCDEIVQACTAHQIESVLTHSAHASGSDRLAEACLKLQMPDEAVLVNVQGDEPLIAPELINAVAQMLYQQSDCAMATAACPIDRHSADFSNPNIVKVVLDKAQKALYFSRSNIPFQRDSSIPSPAAVFPFQANPLRHLGIYSYRAGFIQQFAALPASPLEQLESLEQLRALWHGFGIAVHIARDAPGPSVDTMEDLEKVRVICSQN